MCDTDTNTFPSRKKIIENEKESGRTRSFPGTFACFFEQAEGLFYVKTRF